MFLTKNKLKKNKNVDDGIEYLNYMKYSHLDIPEVKNTSIQTGIESGEKGVDKAKGSFNSNSVGVGTMDDLNVLKGIYRVILEEAKAFPHKRVDKQVQVFTEMLDRTKPKIKTPPTSESDKDYPILDTLATVGYYTGKGLYHTGRLGLKAVDYMSRASDRESEDEEEEQQQETQPTFLPSDRARQRSRSRDDEPTNEPSSSSNAPPPNNMTNRFLRRGASRSRSSSRDGGYPKNKKSK